MSEMMVKASELSTMSLARLIEFETISFSGMAWPASEKMDLISERMPMSSGGQTKG